MAKNFAQDLTHAGIDIRDLLADDDGTRRYLFSENLREGQRIGQAWMNAADPALYNALTGTLFDPFHRDSAEAVVKAVEWLTR